MATKQKKKSTAQKIVSAPRRSKSRPIVGIIFGTLGLLALAALIDFDMSQSRMVTTEHAERPNRVGMLGAEFSFYSFHLIGLAAWLIPLYFFTLATRFIWSQTRGKRVISAVAIFVSLLVVAGLAALAESTESVSSEGGVFQRQLVAGMGGSVGSLLGITLLVPIIGTFGAALIFTMGLVISSILLFTDNIGNFFEYTRTTFHAYKEKREAAKAARREAKAALAIEKAKEKEMTAAERKAAKLEKKKQAKAAAAAAKEAKSKKEAADESDAFAGEVEENPPGTPKRYGLLDQVSGPPPGVFVKKQSAFTGTSQVSPPPKSGPSLKLKEDEPEVEAPVSTPKKPPLDPKQIKIFSGEKVEKAVASIPESRGDYKFPPLELLSDAEDRPEVSPDDHRETMEALVRTLDEFGVKVVPGEIHTGPVITRYEVTPAAGVRVEKILNLDKNIALGLRALSVRILAPVPGKGSVGIEVPNKIASAVCMREIIESRAWADSSAEIPVVLGKDVTGKPIVADLTKMPHVLIAGSTGSGKTVCINTVIASLLYHAGPDDLRFIMVDPKVVEMQVYNDLPHMLIPVVTEAKRVPGALKWLIAEMERRYQIFAKENVRNIAGFNAKLIKNKEEAERAAEMDAEMTAEERYAVSQVEVPRDDDAFEIPKKKLPYIVCVIDELADLMMVAPADIETCIARLAQLARAAGIHLILATQRPSVNVITGVIKANLPCRISFKVASKVDSRTILDGSGAENLIGKGDMLFIPPGTSNLTRAQGAFVSDEEINGIVDYLKEHNNPPVFAEEVQRQIESDGEDGGDNGLGASDGGDELLPDAIEVLRSTKRASTSMLQRRLRIGYNRAARLMEELEDRQIVGPDNGSSPREILVDLDAT